MGSSSMRVLRIWRKGYLMTIETAFLNDKDIARILNLSPSWVRGQRFKRKHGLAHILDLEPRYIGSLPRYVRGDVDAFVASIAG